VPNQDAPALDPRAYDRFAVVALGTPEIVAAVERVRQMLPPSGRPILPAHVTVKGTFVEPTDLDEIVARVGRACAEAEPFALTTGAVDVWSDEHGSGVLLHVEAAAAGVRLHWRLVEELKGLGTTTYHGEDIGVYRPHLTIVQQIPAEHAHAAVAVVERKLPGFTFTVTELALVGRRGGLAWETLTTFPLGPAAPR
jgi:2'-5' RNA ligase